MSKRFIYYGSFASVQFFSDLFGMPDAAYSLRKLTPNATNCIRVRRSSDNTEQDIGFVANVPNSPIDTTALLAFVGAGNGFVTAAYNQNTSGTNFTETSMANQVRIVNGGVLETDGGLASLFYLDASRLVNDSIAGRSTVSIFRVHNTSDTIYLTFYNIEGQANGYNYVAHQASIISGIINNYGSPTLYVDGIIPSPLSNRGHVFTAQNGRKIITEIGGTTTTWTRFNIGEYRPSFNFEGHIPEFIVYFSDKSADRTAIETNINTYYNVF